MFLSPRLTALSLAFSLAALSLVAFSAQAQETEKQQAEEQPIPWSAKEIETSQAQCRANITATGIEGPKVERYCECATKALQARFSAAEVRKMQREHDPGESEDSRPPKLAKTLEQCSPVLESQ